MMQNRKRPEHRKHAAQARRRKRTGRRFLSWLLVCLVIAGAALAVHAIWPGRFFPAIAVFGDSGPRRVSLASVDLESTDWGAIESDPARFRLSQQLMLINGEYGLPDGFAPKVAYYKDTTVLMNEAMLDDYARLTEKVTETTGQRMYVSSLLRSRAEQTSLHLNDPEFAQKPGHSEHETGLAADVYVFEYAGMHFINSAAGRFVNESSWKYGFIIRYPKGKENITGIPYEPWHLRYVGPLHAAAMQAAGLTFEEYVLSFEPGAWYRYDGHLISRQPLSGPLTVVSGTSPVLVSPDNTGHVFITVLPPSG